MSSDPSTLQTVQENWQRVYAEVADAAQHANRPLKDIQIIGVTKYVDAPLAKLLFESGCQHLAENRPQLLWDKAEHFAAQGLTPTWHLIGHLQRNKIRKTLKLISYLHSLDSLRLAESIHEEVVTQQLPPLPVLLEVNVTGDSSKTGTPPSEAEKLLEASSKLSGLKVCGLMAMSSQHGSVDLVRREFAAVRQLRDQLQQRVGSQCELNELSMGMSGDFREAIAEGATMIRIGSNLWKSIGV